MTKQNKTGCFSWVASVRVSANERWAKVRNRLRRQVVHDNKNMCPLDPVTLLDETGNGDVVLRRTPMPIPDSPRIKKTSLDVYAVDSKGDTCVADDLTDAHVQVHVAEDSDDTSQFKTQLSAYIQDIITSASAIVKTQIKQDETQVIVDADFDDISIASSSNISEIAEKVVAQSLTNIIAGKNENQSAIGGTKVVAQSLTNNIISGKNENQSAIRGTKVPRTVNEMMEHLGTSFVRCNEPTGLPRVDQ